MLESALKRRLALSDIIKCMREERHAACRMTVLQACRLRVHRATADQYMSAGFCTEAYGPSASLM